MLAGFRDRAVRSAIMMATGEAERLVRRNIPVATSDCDHVGAMLTIDIVAAVKEALRDSAVRDQIRSIVLECASLPANDVDDLLDARAAATFLSMTPAALRMAVYRGSIPCVRIGRRLRFRRSDLSRR